MDRRVEIDMGLAEVRQRIADAERAAGRPPGSAKLIAVTKTLPASDIALAADLGVRDVGENRDQEARVKSAQLADRELTWHFIGQLQRNKCPSVARYAHVVHSVDRAELVTGLDRGAGAAERRVRILIQVSLDGQVHRGGVAAADVLQLADMIASAQHLDLRGVMAVAPLGVDPARAFATLADIAATVRAEHPAAVEISAGMSGDLEQAIEAGATYVRVGTAIFGRRPENVSRLEEA
jgi:PLP dependent protein